jgi:glycosyltransferase involved in cell wall biosynthesis
VRRVHDLICLSHLRWDFVFQRPNHLMTRCARERRVFFLEEPLFDADQPYLSVREVSPQLFVVTPRLTRDTRGESVSVSQKRALRELMDSARIDRPILWFYTPMALTFANDLPASLVVYDCMDELSLFKGAPPELSALERDLLDRADLVFTGGASLHAVKSRQHERVHLFPSSIDVSHFGMARGAPTEPSDQMPVGRPRIGFFGVIDERIDLELLRAVAEARPMYHFVLVGPVVKIDPATIPVLPNIHCLGQKRYSELPSYLAHWDVAMMPFAQNDSTRFISPTKTLEYLAGGKPVVSTPIRDVVSPYGEQGLVHIAEPQRFADAIDAALAEDPRSKWPRVDAMLALGSWDRTWTEMSALMARALSTGSAAVARDWARPHASTSRHASADEPAP